MPERIADRARFLGDQLLIAMPAMSDPHFDHAVTYICEHGPEGALGIVINRPLGLTLGTVLTQLELGCDDPATRARTVYFGGPVLPERGFVLHDSGSRFDSTLRVNDRFSVTTSRDVLAAIADGRGPQQALVALGYAGWGAGQLEAELADNAWLSAPADDAIVFDADLEQKWERAIGKLGVDFSMLSGEAGHA